MYLYFINLRATYTVCTSSSYPRFIFFAASQNNLGDKSDLSHSVEAEYIIVNDDSSEKKDEPQTIPVFITVSHFIHTVFSYLNLLQIVLLNLKIFSASA